MPASVAALVLALPSTALAAGDAAHGKQLLLYAVVNFALLSALAFWKGRKPLREFLVRRYQEITIEMHQVEEARDALNSELDNVNGQLKAVDSEADELIAGIVAAAEQQAKQIEESAAAAADAARRGAQQQVAALEDAARQRIVNQATVMLTDKARDALESSVDGTRSTAYSQAGANRIGASS